MKSESPESTFPIILLKLVFFCWHLAFRNFKTLPGQNDKFFCGFFFSLIRICSEPARSPQATTRSERVCSLLGRQGPRELGQPPVGGCSGQEDTLTQRSHRPCGTFKMVIFQVKLSTAFCSFRSFRPSLVPMLCKCSWNSMAERNKNTDFSHRPTQSGNR